jgi:hypothetical protein
MLVSLLVMHYPQHLRGDGRSPNEKWIFPFGFRHVNGEMEWVE